MACQTDTYNKREIKSELGHLAEMIKMYHL